MAAETNSSVFIPASETSIICSELVDVTMVTSSHPGQILNIPSICTQYSLFITEAIHARKNK